MIPIVVKSKYPRGENGSLMSVDLTARAAAEGRLNPKVREWAQNAVVGAGSPRDDMGRARAIHDAVRQQKPYFPDPVEAEMIPAAECTLASCGGISFKGGDCDDLTVALVAALESIGIRCAVVGHQYDNDTIEHVLAAVWIAGQYHYADPASNLPFGNARRPRRERMVDVPALSLLCDAVPRCNDGVRPAMGAEHGDFVGVGNAEAKMDPTMEESNSAAAVNELAGAYGALERAWYEAALAYNTMQGYRKITNKSPVDSNVYATATGGSWTPDDESSLRNLATISSLSRQYVSDGISGARPVGRTNTSNGVVLAVWGTSESPQVQEQNGNVLLVNAPGTGATEVVPANFVGVGSPLAIVITIAAVIAVVAVCDAAKDHIVRVQTKDRMDHQRYLLQRGIKPDEVVALEQSLADRAAKEAAARTKVEGESGLNAVARTVQVATYGAIAVGVGYAVFQAVSTLRARRYQLSEGY